jgi:hypothetical protein
MNDPNNIDTKYEMNVHITKALLSFLKNHWWKVILIIFSLSAIIIPFVWIDLSGLAGLFK